MNTKRVLMAATASMALAGAADAGGFKNWYIGLEGGPSWIADVDSVVTAITPEDTTVLAGTLEFDQGWAFLATAGYSLTDQWRFEGELGYRNNKTTSATSRWSSGRS